MAEEYYELSRKYHAPYWISAFSLLLVTFFAKGSSFSIEAMFYVLMYVLASKAIADFLFNKTMILPGGFFERSAGIELRLFAVLVVALPMALFSLFMV